MLLLLPVDCCGVCQPDAEGIGDREMHRTNVPVYRDHKLFPHLPPHCSHLRGSKKRDGVTSQDGKILFLLEAVYYKRVFQYFFHSLTLLTSVYRAPILCAGVGARNINRRDKQWEERTHIKDASQSVFSGW